MGKGQASSRGGAGQPRGLRKLVCTEAGPVMVGMGSGKGSGWVVPWLAPGCMVFIRDADNHGGHSLPLSPVPGLCLLGITVSVTKSLLSWGWRGARLSSSR